MSEGLTFILKIGTVYLVLAGAIALGCQRSRLANESTDRFCFVDSRIVDNTRFTAFYDDVEGNVCYSRSGGGLWCMKAKASER
jgi:hypothetical protein